MSPHRTDTAPSSAAGDTGLSHEEAARLTRYGPNAVIAERAVPCTHVVARMVATPSLPPLHRRPEGDGRQPGRRALQCAQSGSM